MTPERFLSDAELERFMSAARGRRHYVLLVLLSNLGIRPSEATNLTIADVHVDQRPAWVRVRRLKKRKAIAEHDDIEVSDRVADLLADHLATLPADSARVFQTHRRSLQRTFRRYARIAGLWRGRHLYVLRHTAATRMYRTTRDITMVQAMLGHENPDTSSIYAHVPRAMLVDATRSVPVVV